MLPLGVRNVLRGMREGDSQRTSIGALLLLAVLYRWARRRASLIARYEIREGDDIRITLPKERSVDRAGLEAALVAALSAPTDLDDDLLGPTSTEDEREDRQDDDPDE